MNALSVSSVFNPTLCLETNSMNHLAKTFTLSACAVAASILISACGGAEAPDTTAPTVTITDSVPGTASGPVTFTFTFSEDVGTSFTAEDIVVEIGTKGAFTMVSGTVATLVVTPPADATGSLSVSVDAAKFEDLAFNANTVPASASQAYDTTVVIDPPPTTGTMLLNFDDLLPTDAYGGEGGEGSGVVAAPTGGGSGMVYEVLRSGGQPYALAVLETTLPLTTTRKTISAQVYSPTAGIPMVIKLEGAGVATAEIQASETVVQGWQTLTWTFPTGGTATYTKIVLLPNLGTVDAAPGKSYYFDDFKLLDAGGGGVGTSTLPITFDDSAVTYKLTGFEGAENSTLVTDPAGGTNKVVQVVKTAGAPWYAGTTVSTGANNSIATIPFTSSAKTMTLRVYSPGPGMIVRLKVENANDVTVTCETDATTVGTGWETLTFNFANPGLAPPVTGGLTAGLNLASTYNKASVFMSVAPSAVGQPGTFYFDDLAFGL